MPSENHMTDDNAMDDAIEEPSQRVKQLSLLGSYVTVDDTVPIKRYWRSGKELMRMASVYMDEGQLDRAFILYMKYVTLFIEKLPKHIEYRTSDAADKALVNANCKTVILIAEELKKKLTVKFQKEYDVWIKEKERRDAEEEIRLAKMREEAERQREAEEAKRLADVQHKLDAQIVSVREKRASGVTPSAPSASIIDLTDDTQDQFKVPPSITGAGIDIPSFDRTTKPSLLSFHDDDKSGGLRRIIVPQGLCEKFLTVAKDNTLKNIETCAILTGKFGQNCFTITHVLVPSQRGTADSCQTDNEEEVFHVQDEHDLITLGWIHTHPSQSAFMSSIDLHTHCSYQLMLPEAIAIVCSPKFDTIGVFSLTPSYGLNFIAKCRLNGFHPHPKDPPLYGESSHVLFDDTKKIQLIDLR